jgi:prepilin peptidase CpaA
MSGPTEIQIITSLALLGVAAITDVWRGKVYNWLTLSGLMIGLSIGFDQGGWLGLAFSALGALVGLLILLLPYLQKGVAAGDVKLFIALGAVLGHSAVLEVGAVSLGVAAVFAVVQLARAGQLSQVLRRMASWVVPSLRQDSVADSKPDSLKLPLALPVLIATTVWWGRRFLQ